MSTADTTPTLTFLPALTRDALHDWCAVHNRVVPDPISLRTAQDRSRTQLLQTVYLGGSLVGCSTTGRPDDVGGLGRLIVRVLPDFRGRGLGTAMFNRGLTHVLSWGATTLETVVWEPNVSGLRFARHRGFVEVERYELPGLDGTWIDLHLDLSTRADRDPSS